MNLWKVARPAVWAIFRTVSRLNLFLRIHEYRYVFILRHVRSGFSTLLAHIPIASHPNIAGAGEMHSSYRTPADLPTLVLKTCEFLHRPILREDYIVDQINHDYVSNEVLSSKQLYKCVILLRKPETTLKSMMSLMNLQESQALEHYINRLKKLTHYGLLLRERALLVEYDDLVDHSETTLATLTRFLRLESQLTPKYAAHRMTRRVEGYGDPSTNIAVGHIIRTPNHQFPLSKHTLITAQDAFYKCRDRNCKLLLFMP